MLKLTETNLPIVNTVKKKNVSPMSKYLVEVNHADLKTLE